MISTFHSFKGNRTILYQKYAGRGMSCLAYIILLGYFSKGGAAVSQGPRCCSLIVPASASAPSLRPLSDAASCLCPCTFNTK